MTEEKGNTEEFRYKSFIYAERMFHDDVFSAIRRFGKDFIGIRGILKVTIEFYPDSEVG